jgi:hypothetical protein
MKKKSETGIWVLRYDEGWGLRGSRNVDVFYFRNKPDEEKVKQTLEKHGLDYGRPEVWTLSRRTCCKAYPIKEYHGY